MIRALLIDLDDTILCETMAMESAINALVFNKFAHFQLITLDDTDSLLFDIWGQASSKYWQQYIKGEISFQQQRQLRVRALFGEHISDQAANTIFDQYLALYESYWTAAPGCELFMLKTASIPKVVVTNGNKAQAIQKLKKLHLLEYFSAIFTAEEFAAKPNPAIFNAALKILNCAPQDALMIGDDELTDIAPAKQLGIHTFQVSINNPNQSLLNALSLI
jgi:HAD superfamily hydrolase (TIGR01549 family)